MDDVITLLEEVNSFDDDYNQTPRYTEYQTFCRVRSIGRSEFYAAGQAGLEPAYVVEVFSGDYNGERVVRYKDALYSVYRTYRRFDDDITELYIEDKAGVTDGN